MSGRPTLLRSLVTVLVVAAACSSTQLPDIEQSTPTQEPPRSTTPKAPPSSDTTPPSPAPDDPIDLPGRLAALGPNGELVVRSDDGAWQQWSADDVLVSQFSWSSAGDQLAWAELTSSETTLVAGDGDERTELAATRPPFYLWWTRDGSQVSHLGSSSTQVTLELSNPGAVAATPVTESSPLFYSYSPTGRLVVHQDEADLSLIDGDTATPVARTAGNFQAPVWLDENRVVAVVELEGGDALAIIDVTDNVVTPLFDVEDRIFFTASPDGTRLAYQILEDAAADNRPVRAPLPQTEGNPPDVLVLDLVTQEVTLAFVGQALWLDWSPDSSALAALVATDNLTWRVWDDRELVRTGPVQISPVFAENYVPFYDQYTQSMTGWSPDSAWYAFAAELDGRTGVYVQPAEVGGETRHLGPGVAVAWAPTPP